MKTTNAKMKKFIVETFGEPLDQNDDEKPHLLCDRCGGMLEIEGQECTRCGAMSTNVD